MGMIMILRTTAHKNPPKNLKKYIGGLIVTHWKVFNNNNNKMISQFFQEPLLRELWELFPKEHLIEFLLKLDDREQKLMRKDFVKY
jgi:hypothetical protein